METDDNLRFALALLDIVNKKKEEIKTLTSEIIELEDNPKNIKKIKQNVQSILNAVAFCSNSNSSDLQLVNLRAGLVFDEMRRSSTKEDRCSIEPKLWGVLIIHRLEDFCTSANAWNPIEFSFNKKDMKIEFKNLNIGVIQNK